MEPATSAGYYWKLVFVFLSTKIKIGFILLKILTPVLRNVPQQNNPIPTEKNKNK